MIDDLLFTQVLEEPYPQWEVVDSNGNKVAIVSHLRIGDLEFLQIEGDDSIWFDTKDEARLYLLRHLNGDDDTQQDRFSRLVVECVQKGYKPNWARIRYQSQHGVWPTSSGGVRTPRFFIEYERQHNIKLEG